MNPAAQWIEVGDARIGISANNVAFLMTRRMQGILIVLRYKFGMFSTRSRAVKEIPLSSSSKNESYLGPCQDEKQAVVLAFWQNPSPDQDGRHT